MSSAEIAETLATDITLPPERRYALQLERLRRLLIHAHERFEFYRARMEDARFDPWRLRDVSELQALPLLDKATYRGFAQDLARQRGDDLASSYLMRTSGSTGMPLTVYRSAADLACARGKLLRALTYNGYRPEQDVLLEIAGVRQVATASGAPPPAATSSRRHRVPFDEPVERMVEEYVRLRPDVLIANKLQLLQMALHVERHGINIVPPRMCLPFSEVLDARARALIGGVFGHEAVLDIYSSAEFSVLSFQVRGRPYQRFSHDTNVLELMNDGRIEREQGRCVITELCSYEVPLIRYALGDWLETTWHEGEQVVTAIRGRADDELVWRDGSITTPFLLFQACEREAAVRQYRVFQEAYDELRLVLVVGPGTDKTALAERLVTHLRQTLRDDVRYSVEFVPELAPEANGKVRAFISRVQREAAGS